MTTIACRNRRVSADTGVSSSSGGRVALCSKIAKAPSGSVGGACGRAVWADAFLAWIRADRHGSCPEQKDGDTGLVAELDGTFTLYQDNGRAHVRGPYIAIGSGCSEAFGAFYMGARADQAVNAAIEHDDGTYGEVETLTVGS